jgi:hypothetical protein
MGRKFFESDIPRLADALGKIATALDGGLADELKKAKQREFASQAFQDAICDLVGVSRDLPALSLDAIVNLKIREDPGQAEIDQALGLSGEPAPTMRSALEAIENDCREWLDGNMDSLTHGELLQGVIRMAQRARRRGDG